MNAPEVFEQFKEHDKKVIIQPEEKLQNTCLFIINEEDHTFGNVVKMMLLRNPKIRYVAYRKPHPLENKIEIKIQTNGDISPLEAFQEALKNLNEDVDDCTRQLEEEFQNYKNNGIY